MRKLNIVVAGATGYTGKIVCQYLKQKGVQQWGIAGRDSAKMSALCAELSIEIPMFAIDITNPVSLDEMCTQAVCVISCTGPFSEVGMPLVDACVRCYTNYIDSTGEFKFVRKVAEKHHSEATRRGLAIVSCCGFDSVPSDIGNYVTHRDANEEVTDVRCYIQWVSAGMSAGTLKSIAASISTVDSKDLSPTSLVPPDAVQPTAAPSQKGIWYSRKDKRWSSPFLMAACNERVVRRSNALRGSSAVYSEALEGSFFSSLKATTTKYVKFAISAFSPLRKLVFNNTTYPSGKTQGPQQESKKNCSYTLTFIGTTSSGKRIQVTYQDDREMYDATGLYLSECALTVCALREAGKIKPGVLTPSVAFGDDLVERLRAVDIKISSQLC